MEQERQKFSGFDLCRTTLRRGLGDDDDDDDDDDDVIVMMAMMTRRGLGDDDDVVAAPGWRLVDLQDVLTAAVGMKIRIFY